jgi:hypothetical protein
VPPQLWPAQVRVQPRGVAEARALPLARGDDARPGRRRLLVRRLFSRERGDQHARHLHVQVDAVEQRTGDARAVALEHTR